MKLRPISFQELMKQSTDLFEGVLVMGQRARQINARRAAERATIEEDYFDDEYALMTPVDEDAYVEEEKSTLLAMDDYLSSQLSWRYALPEDEGEDEVAGEEAKETTRKSGA